MPDSASAVTRAQRQRLLVALQQIPLFDTQQGRDLLLADLPSVLRDSLQRSPSKVIDLHEIVDAAARFGPLEDGTPALHIVTDNAVQLSQGSAGGHALHILYQEWMAPLDIAAPDASPSPQVSSANTGKEVLLPKWQATDSLGDIATQLRAAVFPSQSRAARHFGIANTTVGRYETYRSGTNGLKPPFGYLAALFHLLEGQNAPLENGLEYQSLLVQKLEEIRKRFYLGEAGQSLQEWVALERTANSYRTQYTPPLSIGPLATESTGQLNTGGEVAPPAAPDAKMAVHLADPIKVSSSRCPYPGMVPFRIDDADIFHGRTDEINHMLLHLRKHPILCVLAPSGAGKSSLLTAGLLPRLQQPSTILPGPWTFIEIRPGSTPTHTLAAALGSNLKDPASAVAAYLAAHHPAARLLIVMDQFEEVFTQAEKTEQAAFFTLLRAIASIPTCRIVVALRSDFYTDLLDSDLWELVAPNRLEIPRLRGKALREAIAAPAAAVGVVLDPALIERLVADAGSEPGVLPLLQETLVLLWDRVAGGQLPVTAYEALGGPDTSGLAVALALHADAVFGGLAPTQQALARRIFLRLVQFGEGRANTRRQQPVRALLAEGDDPADVAVTLATLIENRLLTASGNEAGPERSIDLAHEVLLIGWPQFAGWIKKWGAAEQERRNLERLAAAWERRGRISGWLDQADLLDAERWLSSPAAEVLGVSPSLQALVEASRPRIAGVATIRLSLTEQASTPDPNFGLPADLTPLTPAWRRALLKALLQMPGIGDTAIREQLLSDLPPGLLVSLTRQASPQIDLNTILHAAERWGGGSLDQLLVNALVLASGTTASRAIAAFREQLTPPNP